MAIRHIREAYNQESGDHSICQAARLDYVPGKPGEPQQQIITLDIVKSDGLPETVKTPPHALDANPHEQVRMLAKTLKDRDGVKDTLPAPYVPPPVDASASLWERLKGAAKAPPPPSPSVTAPSQSEASPIAPPPVIPATLPKNPWIE